MTDTIPKSEVARVLAEQWSDELRLRRGGVRGVRSNDQMRPGLLAIVSDIAGLLEIRPEFESALKALEEEARRG